MDPNTGFLSKSHRLVQIASSGAHTPGHRLCEDTLQKRPQWILTIWYILSRGFLHGLESVLMASLRSHTFRTPAASLSELSSAVFGDDLFLSFGQAYLRRRCVIL